MRIAFRADASPSIGMGHVVRCSSLAAALTANGHDVTLFCRELHSSISAQISGSGLSIKQLAQRPAAVSCSQAADAKDTVSAMGSDPWDWMVLDHYDFGLEWEQHVSSATKRLMVIDDIPSRPHACDVLLDQNYVRCSSRRYDGLVAPGCSCLLGPEFALVSSTFRDFREKSLLRKRRDGIRRLIIFMGGGDVFEATSFALEAVGSLNWNFERIDCVVGANCPKLDDLATQVMQTQGAVLHVQTPSMAELMAMADCAITGGGSVSWEKCTLGLPSLVMIMADNQAPSAVALHSAGAQLTLGKFGQLSTTAVSAALAALTPDKLLAMSRAAAKICDGAGSIRVSKVLETKRKD